MQVEYMPSTGSTRKHQTLPFMKIFGTLRQKIVNLKICNNPPYAQNFLIPEVFRSTEVFP